MEKNNQLENQVENQDDFSLNKFDNKNNDNIVCNIYKEQFDLINELPEADRLKVLYLSVFNAFSEYEKNIKKNQLENQVDYTYISNSISIYTSIYNSLSNYSKILLKLLNKTISCKIYKNWGGKRKNAGRPKGSEEIPLEYKYYGKYNNVMLSKEHYDKLLGICASKDLLNELVNSFSINIEVGKERPYIASLPNAHYERLRSYYNFRKKYPDKFNTSNPQDRSHIFRELEEKARKEGKI